MESTPVFEHEPISLWMQDDLDKLLSWAANTKFSDISLISGSPIWGRLNGKWGRVTGRPVSSDEVFMLADLITRSPGTSARLKGGEDVDPSYEVRLPTGGRARFRVNGTSGKDGYSTGANLVFRSIPSIPLSLDELGIEQELRDGLFPDNGLVLITGVMGTGKTTLLGATIREILRVGGRSVLTYESPIEFDLKAVPELNGPIMQHEIPIHLCEFARAARNAARRAADVIWIGEARDKVTLHSMLEVSDIGTATYSTVHTKSVHDTPSRILNVFTPEERYAVSSTLFSNLRCVVQQRLLRTPDGDGRVGVRESLILNEDDRRELQQTDLRNVTEVLKQKTIDRGTDLLTQTRKLYDEGRISLDSLLEIERERIRPGDKLKVVA